MDPKYFINKEAATNSTNLNLSAQPNQNDINSSNKLGNEFLYLVFKNNNLNLANEEKYPRNNIQDSCYSGNQNSFQDYSSTFLKNFVNNFF